MGGIGLELLEMQVSDDNRAGLVMVGGCSPGSKAEKCGLFRSGDVLVGISSAMKIEYMFNFGLNLAARRSYCCE